MWEAIQYVTTGLTLVAFLVTVIAWAFKSKSEERERLIKAASEDKRADLVRSALEFFEVEMCIRDRIRTGPDRTSHFG